MRIKINIKRELYIKIIVPTMMNRSVTWSVKVTERQMMNKSVMWTVKVTEREKINNI